MSQVPVRFRRTRIIPTAFLVLKEEMYTDCGVNKVVPMGIWNYLAGQYANDDK